MSNKKVNSNFDTYKLKNKVSNKRKIRICTEYITLGQLLKYADFIQSGGHEKVFIQENDILVNGEVEKRRGRKLKNGDLIIVKDVEILIES